MKQEETKNEDIESFGEDTPAIEASISEEGMSYLFEMVSKTMYQNPIQSIVREITSNCFDTHKEAGVELPVILSIDEDQGGTYISFQDFGTGLSEDQIENVYMKYFTSTKRQSNDYIGMFGLGSKSPLSYRDDFQIITRVDGIEYNYLLHKGEKRPTIDKLYQEETKEPNGTIIKIYLKHAGDEYGGDKKDFISAAQKQLCYFDNVIFNNFKIALDRYLFPGVIQDLSKEYNIYEGKYFKFRNTYQYSQEMHICLGKVSYPIDWSEIKIGQIFLDLYKNNKHHGDKIGVPVALKFEIGELKVTPNRESLRYDDETRVLIVERIKECIQELREMYLLKIENIDNIFDYLKIINKDKFIYLDAGEIKVNSIVKDILIKYNPFKDLALTIPQHPFQFLETIGMLEGGETIKKKKQYKSLVEGATISGNKIILLRKEPSKWRSLFLNAGQVVRENKMTFYEWCSWLNIPFHTLGKARIILAYKREMIRNIVTHVYEEVHVPDTWIKDYKLSHKGADRSALRKAQGKVLYHNLSRPFLATTAVEITLKDLYSFTGLFIYGYREDTDILNSVFQLIHEKKSLKNYNSYNYKLRVARISYSNTKYFKDKLKNIIYVRDMISDNRVFRNVATAGYLKLKRFKRIYNLDASDIGKVNYAIGQKISGVKKFIKENWNDDLDINSKIAQEIIEIAITNDWFNISIMSDVTEIETYFRNVELLHYMNYCQNSYRLIAEFLIANKKRVNLDYYKKPVIDTIEEPIASNVEELQKEPITEALTTFTNSNNELVEVEIL